ncbi:unnamed protein product [Meganyctiphanes norvegica]|uniref:Methyltransferase FkbM domain-containing protein n=1 Tax=Meganyctiphanes norvegica TaxID=48144 RepID=A0AAV2R4R0_MEGNR
MPEAGEILKRLVFLLILMFIGIPSGLWILFETGALSNVRTVDNIKRPPSLTIYDKISKIGLVKPSSVKEQETIYNNKNISQDNQILIKQIKEEFLYSPSKLSYNLKDHTNFNPSMGQTNEIRKILGYQKNGFFVECGALDGETGSNTLVFEKKLGWSGLLIEGDPKNFQLLQKKNRKSWSINTCLSSKPYPNTVLFEQKFNVGKISNLSPSNSRKGYAKVHCLPLYSILRALGTTTVDYFSLSVQGLELQVLKTIPWDRVNIRTLSVEFTYGKKGQFSIVNYMLHKGYYVYSEVIHPDEIVKDFIFYRKDVVPKQSND